MAFSRDASYAFFGQGNLRVEFYITLGDGTVIQELDYISESYVADCPDFIAGVWNSTDRSYSFHITKDHQFATLKFDSWRVRGGFTMSSSTTPHLADGSLWTPDGGKPDATEISPGLHYGLSMGGADVNVDATLSSGRRIAFKGRGGSTRLWATDGWLKLCEGWKVFRAWAGPYSIVYWDVMARMSKPGKYVSGHLFHNDQLLVGSRIGNVSDEHDYVLFTDNFDGEMSGRYKDKNTGHTFEFVSPIKDKKWRFDLQHVVTQYEMGAGAGFGMSGFANRVVGGEVGDVQYEGRGHSEQTYWPEHIEQWKIWLVWGFGFLGKGKVYVMKMVSYIL
ncbi:diels-Alderase ccsF [Colletotrichum liriopes]|uniref:Diels-Alderase ccsF n=1 Tax=Colletotrichum liriopes TaxID=708192 RepID=A0AA37LZX9_9PEZI|nr:diels-Alderase ccsF [Colletotrichum liriopes]